MRTKWVILDIVFAAMLSACRDAGPTPIDTAGPDYPCRDLQTGLGRPCRALWLEPAEGARGSIILVGDTVPVRALSDSGFTVSNWSVGPTLEKRTASGAILWSKALTTGNSTVTAMAAGGRSATTSITAVDSTAIAAIVAPANYSETIRAGTFFLSVALRDASGRDVAAIPQWTASNSLVTIAPQAFTSYGYFQPGAYLTLKGQGSVTLTVTFKGLTSQVQLFITP